MIANATITARNIATGSTRSVQSDTEGRYLISSLQPGPYEVRVEQSGFTTKTLTGITLNVGDTQQLEVSLSLGGVSDTVSVEDSESLLQTQTSSNRPYTPETLSCES